MKSSAHMTFRGLAAFTLIFFSFGCGQQSEPAGGESDKVKQQRTTVAQYTGIWSSGEVDLIDKLFHPDFIRHASNASMTATRGAEGMKGVIGQFRKAYSEIEVNLDEEIYAGDKAVIRWSIGAVNSGPGFIPPTGKAITLSGVSILGFTDGLISSEYVAADNLDLYQQLGFTMVPPEAAVPEDVDPE